MAAPGTVTIVYQASDGSTFDTQADADEYQAELNQRQEFGELFDATHLDYSISALLRPNLLNWLVDNSAAIESILEGGDFEAPVEG